MEECFKLPPLVAYKRPNNIKEKLIRSKIPPVPSRPKRELPGMTKCNKCPICPFVQVTKTVKATASSTVVRINKPVNCKTKNAIYCITCKKCSAQYIGETDRTLQDRFSDHRGYVTNRHLHQATGYHYNLPGHQISDMQVTVVEKVFNPNGQFRRTREQMFIQDFNSKYKGLNRKS